MKKEGVKDKKEELLSRALGELEEARIEAIKWVNENPFIRKKVSFLERFIAYRMGIYNPDSQADHLIRAINYRYQEYRDMALKVLK